MTKQKSQKEPQSLEEFAAEQTAMTKGRGGNSNFPNANMNDKPEDVKRVLSEILKWYNLPKAKDDDEIEERTQMFFQFCAESGERPTVEKYCLAIGYTRQSVNEWEHGVKCSPRRADIMKKAKEILAAYDAGMAVEGKMNPVPYIFRAKNYYGMKDTADVIISPANPLGSDPSQRELEERISDSVIDVDPSE